MKATAKKILSTTVALCICALSLVSCAGAFQKDKKIKILCTVFPVYDWAKNIAGDSDNVEVSLLVENGTDLHSFQPSFGDMAKIKDSDIVVYIGGESDKWVAESIDENASAVELCSLEDTVLLEASSDRFASAHTHEDGEECHEAHDHQFDEHLWLSLGNAEAACRAIEAALCLADGDNSELYRSNADLYISKLGELDEKLQAIASRITDPIIFADRFPFVYLLEDYGISYFAAFSGCTTDTDADFDTVISLTKKTDQYSAKFIFTTERPVEGLAESIIAQSRDKSAAPKQLNSMQALGKSDIESGVSYISVMEQNIDTLSEICD